MAIAPRRQLVEYKNMQNGAPTTPTVRQDAHDGFSSIPRMEDFRTEFKRDVKSSDLERKVVAFLNSPDGGRIFIGVADDGTPVGVVDSDLAQRQIKDRLRDNIRPSCLGLFDVRLVGAANAGAPVVCIDIAHGLEGPYYLRKIGRSPEGCLIRMGSAVESMTEEQIEKVYAKRLRNSLGRIVSPRQGLSFSQLRIYYSGKGIGPERRIPPESRAFG